MTEAAPAELDPLACPTCGAQVALAGVDASPCPRCGADVAVPDAHRAAFREEERAATHRTGAQALYAELGVAPGALSRGGRGGAWGSVALGVLAVGLVSASAVIVAERVAAALYRDNLAETVSRTATDAIRILGPGLAVIVGAAIGLRARRRAVARRRLIGGLAAAPPECAGGPPRCRVCGGALAVAPQALGVRCVYCGGDSLVGLPPAWVDAARDDEVPAHLDVEAAHAEHLARRSARERALALQVGAALIALSGVYAAFAARAAAAAGAELRVPPAWSPFAGEPRPLARRDMEADKLAGRVTRLELDAPCTEGVPLVPPAGGCDAHACTLRLYAALREGERATITYGGLARPGRLTVSRHEGVAWSDDPREPFGPRVIELPVVPGAPATFVAPWSAWHELTLTVPAGAWTDRASVCFTAAR